MRPSLLGATVVATLAIIAAPAFAAPVNLVQNGSFENGNYVPNHFTICECDIEPNTPQATAISGWTVVAPPVNAQPDTGIDWLQNYPQYVPLPSDGSKNLDMSGDDPGAIEQSVPTTPGVSYTVTFDVGSNNDPSVMSTAAHTLEVMAGPADQTFSIPRATVGYLHDQLVFTATSSSSLLEFIATDNPPTGTGPVLDNVALFATPVAVVATAEDQCDNGGWSSLVDNNNNAFASQAACDAFATHTTLVAGIAKANCVNVTLSGAVTGGPIRGDVTVPAGATCVLAPGIVITNDVKVAAGATLYDEGANIEGNLNAKDSKGVDIDPGSRVGGDVHIEGLVGRPDGEPVNEICGATVGGDLQVDKGTVGSPAEVGCGPGLGNSVGNNLKVRENAASVTVSNNTIVHDLEVKKNTPGGATIASNTIGHDGNCSENVPVTGSGNNTPPGRPNTCNVGVH